MESENIDIWRQYKNKRNECLAQLRRDKKQYNTDRLRRNNSDPTQQWKAVKQILNIKKTQPPTMIIRNGEAITKPLEIANAMNAAYI